MSMLLMQKLRNDISFTKCKRIQLEAALVKKIWTDISSKSVQLQHQNKKFTTDNISLIFLHGAK